MPLPRTLRVRHLATALAVALMLAGCAPEEGPEPDGAPTASDTAAPNPDSDGVTTHNDDLPTWQAIDGLETPRDDFGTAVIGPEVWAMGGMTGARGNRLVSIEVLDLQSGLDHASG